MQLIRLPTGRRQLLADPDVEQVVEVVDATGRSILRQVVARAHGEARMELDLHGAGRCLPCRVAWRSACDHTKLVVQ